jgi:hypothetical protein
MSDRPRKRPRDAFWFGFYLSHLALRRGKPQLRQPRLYTCGGREIRAVRLCIIALPWTERFEKVGRL